VEECDIFSNQDYIEPTTIFGSESVSSPITSITSASTTATVTTTSQHGLATGDTVVISGATQTEYNGTYTVTVSSGTVFTYTFAGSATTPATGTIVATYSTMRLVRAYTLSDGDFGYAYSQSYDGDALIWKLTSASTDNPGSWAFLGESSSDAHPNADIAWHKLDDGTNLVYYPTVSGTIVTLRSSAITAGGYEFDVLVVGGGGGGGSADASSHGAGGGGGGEVKAQSLALNQGTYTITVDAGGTPQNDGSISSIGSSLTAHGGSRGSNTLSGGSGSGGASGGGFIGGSGFGGGGGGATAVGATGPIGAGGAGLSSTITGSSVTYGVGGTGGASSGGGNQGSGTTNRGNGAGGGNANNGVGASGGSGIVILRWLTSALATHSGGTDTTDGSYTITTFTTSGTFTFTVSEGTESSVGVLDGLDGTGDRIQMVRAFGELYITNGRYIAKVDDENTYTAHAFTLPSDLIAVSMDVRGDLMYILCKYGSTGKNSCRVVVWDLASTEQPNEIIDIPMSGPQWIVNHLEVLRACCARNGVARLYEIAGLVPVKTHEISNAQTETNAQPISPTQTLFLNNNILYFGLWRTQMSGLYAVGQVASTAPLAMILGKRFYTTDYSLHKPYAARAFGPNWYVAFDDNGTASTRRLEDNNSPTRSSNATYESVLLDVGAPEAIKDWRGYIVLSKPIPASCEIKIDAKTDNASSYDSNSLVTLTSSNDYTHDGGTADTFWERKTTSLAGRLLRARIRFTSSGTSKATLYFLSLLSENRVIQ